MSNSFNSIMQKPYLVTRPAHLMIAPDDYVRLGTFQQENAVAWSCAEDFPICPVDFEVATCDAERSINMSIRMRLYNIVFSPLDKVRAAGASYGINVFASGHNGPVPVRYILDSGELQKSFSQLHISPKVQAKIVESLQRRKHYVLHEVGLDPEVAALFGWPPGSHI
jgi:hypothetical protein